MGAAVASSTDAKGQVVNISGLVSGIAQTIHSGVDLTTKGPQVPGSVWFKGILVVGSGLGFVGLGLGLYEGPKSQADYAGLVSNAAGFVAGVAVLMTAPVIATGLGILAIGAGGYQIYQSRIGTNSPSSPPSDYSFGFNYRGNAYTCPSLLDSADSYRSLPEGVNSLDCCTADNVFDNTGGYRGLHTHSGVYTSQSALLARFECDMNTSFVAANEALYRLSLIHI